MIGQTLEYDFREEKQVDYSSLNVEDAIKMISKFISRIWQIHPFYEGNTRTTSVFAIKYLRNFGFAVDKNRLQIIPGIVATEIYINHKEPQKRCMDASYILSVGLTCAIFLSPEIFASASVLIIIKVFKIELWVL